MISLKRIALLLCGIFTVQFGFAQEFEVHKEVGASNPVTVTFSEIDQDFHPSLERIVAPKPGGEAYNEQLNAVKQSRGNKTYGNTSLHKAKKSTSNSRPPAVLESFRGNQAGGIPNDNDIAINNAGTVVSVVNSNISIYDTTGKLMEEHSLQAFANKLNIKGHKYDPRVEYDWEEDRFFITFLNGNVDTTSRIILAFSETSDPTGNWHLYALPGDPLDNKSWSDFPMMALTKDKVYLTINLLYNDSSWQKGFRQSIIWELDKQDGYNGDSLTKQFYSGIEFDGESIRNITPIQGATKLSGNTTYFLSNKNFAQKTDDFFLISLTGNQATMIRIRQINADQAYGAPPDADQPDSTFFATNDSRILDGFIVDGRIHFVGNTINFDNNRATLYHGILTDIANNPPDLDLNIIDHPYLELGYPSIVFAGADKQENKALIIANHAGDTVMPGYSGLYFENGEYSSFSTLKSGSTKVDMQQSLTERWGDYTGLQRRYNKADEYWASGYFGFKENISLARKNGTWITKLQSTWTSGIDKITQKQMRVKAYPNPVKKYVHVEFSIEKPKFLKFNLYTAEGRKVKTLLESLTKPGKNRFSFVVSELPQGAYFLTIKDGDQTVKTKRIIKQ